MRLTVDSDTPMEVATAVPLPGSFIRCKTSATDFLALSAGLFDDGSMTLPFIDSFVKRRPQQAGREQAGHAGPKVNVRQQLESRDVPSFGAALGVPAHDAAVKFVDRIGVGSARIRMDTARNLRERALGDSGNVGNQTLSPTLLDQVFDLPGVSRFDCGLVFHSFTLPHLN
ncbi:MAG: hypothetical protein ABFC67_14770 [Mizugakiibacter sp.]|uniref:hypothetical protein n=1 Tax=Mizugakiibacter sp. TaxID=1972610 RepID=UPI00320DFDE3